MIVQSNRVCEKPFPPASRHQGTTSNGHSAQPSVCINASSIIIQNNLVCENPFPPASGHQGATSNGQPAQLSMCNSASWRLGPTTDWNECTSLDGRKYFYNTVTKQSQWVIPDELKRAREQAENASRTTEVNEICNVSVSIPVPVPVPVPVSDVKTPSNSDAKPSTPVVQSRPTAVTPVSGGTATRSHPFPQTSSLPPGNSGVQIGAPDAQSKSKARKIAEVTVLVLSSLIIGSLFGLLFGSLLVLLFRFILSLTT